MQCKTYVVLSHLPIRRKGEKEMEKDLKGKTFYSFDELAKEYGLPEYKRRTKDKQKLEAQREKFLGTCPYCKEPLTYISGTNVLVCSNEECKGKKVTLKNKKGEDYTIYKPFVKTLDDNGTTIAINIFD